MTTEAQIEKPVVHQAKKAGFFVRKLGWEGMRSAPDDIFAREDRGIVFMEFKRPGQKATRLQELEHARMREAGMEVHVVDSVQQGLEILGIA